jgi:hypothetical protein
LELGLCISRQFQRANNLPCRRTSRGDGQRFIVRACFLEKDQEINYSENRASFRSEEIRILDSTGNVEGTIPLSEADRKPYP